MPTPILTAAEWMGEHVAQLISDACSTTFPDRVATLVYGSFLETAGVAYGDIDLLIVVPGNEPISKRHISIDSQAFDIVGIPEGVIDKLPELSYRMRLPVGLFGFAHGQLIEGVLPNLKTISLTCQSAIKELNRRLAPRTVQILEEAVELALSASNTNGPEKTAMGLVAVGKMLEADLRIRTNNNIASRSEMRRAAQQHPGLVAEYASIATAVAVRDLAPLLAKSDFISKFRKSPLRRQYEIDPAKFGL